MHNTYPSREVEEVGIGTVLQAGGAVGVWEGLVAEKWRAEKWRPLFGVIRFFCPSFFCHQLGEPGDEVEEPGNRTVLQAGSAIGALVAAVGFFRSAFLILMSMQVIGSF